MKYSKEQFEDEFKYHCQNYVRHYSEVGIVSIYDLFDAQMDYLLELLGIAISLRNASSLTERKNCKAEFETLSARYMDGLPEATWTAQQYIHSVDRLFRNSPFDVALDVDDLGKLNIEPIRPFVARLPIIHADCTNWQEFFDFEMCQFTFPEMTAEQSIEAERQNTDEDGVVMNDDLEASFMMLIVAYGSSFRTLSYFLEGAMNYDLMLTDPLDAEEQLRISIKIVRQSFGWSPFHNLRAANANESSTSQNVDSATNWRNKAVIDLELREKGYGCYKTARKNSVLRKNDLVFIEHPTHPRLADYHKRA